METVCGLSEGPSFAGRPIFWLGRKVRPPLLQWPMTRRLAFAEPRDAINWERALSALADGRPAWQQASCVRVCVLIRQESNLSSPGGYLYGPSCKRGLNVSIENELCRICRLCSLPGSVLTQAPRNRPTALLTGAVENTLVSSEASARRRRLGRDLFPSGSAYRAVLRVPASKHIPRRRARAFATANQRPGEPPGRGGQPHLNKERRSGMLDREGRESCDTQQANTRSEFAPKRSRSVSAVSFVCRYSLFVANRKCLLLPCVPSSLEETAKYCGLPLTLSSTRTPHAPFLFAGSEGGADRDCNPPPGTKITPWYTHTTTAWGVV